MYDLIILGAGAAGMTASIYASRYKINHLIFGDKVGGQFVDAHLIENYPGFTSIDGLTLMNNFKSHVESYGVKIREEKVGGIKKVEVSDSVTLAQGVPPDASVGVPPQPSLKHMSLPPFASDSIIEIKTETGEKIETKSLILAMGARHRSLNVPGEENYLGRGVSYCSTCDAPLFKGKVVAVIGGGNSAVTAALHLSEFATKVYLIHRGNIFEKADPVWLDALSKKNNVTKILSTQVKEIFGRNGPKSVETKIEVSSQGGSSFDIVLGIVLDHPFEGSNVLKVGGVFIEVGLMPAISLANQIGVEADSLGYIKATGDLKTNVPGVFAAGDLARQSDVPSLRQIVTSAGQGAIAVHSVYAYLNNKHPGPDWG